MRVVRRRRAMWKESTLLRSLVCILALVALLLTSIPGRCDTTTSAPPGITLESLLGDGGPAKTLRLGELGNDGKPWFEFRLTDEGPSGFSEKAGHPAFGAGIAAEGLFFTSGEEVQLGDTSYLVAYSIIQKPLNVLMDMMGGTPLTRARASRALKATTPLELSLLNLRMIPGLRALRPLDLKALIAAPKPQAVTPTPVATTPLIMVDVAKTMTGMRVDNAKRLGAGMTQYIKAHGEVLPPMTSAAAFQTAVLRFTKPNKSQPAVSVFDDPQLGTPFTPNASLSEKPLSLVRAPADTIALYSSEADASGSRYVIFVDGHVRSVEESEFRELYKHSQLHWPPLARRHPALTTINGKVILPGPPLR